MILGKVAPNSTYGFRTPFTESSPAVWYPANTFAGWSMLISTGISLAIIWLLPQKICGHPRRMSLDLGVFLGALLLGVGADFIYLARLT